MRYAAKTDTTHEPIREALRACGCVVADTSRLSGFVDLVVLRRGSWTLHLVEVKTPGSKGRIRKTGSQESLEQQGFPVVYLKSVDEAIEWATSCDTSGAGS